MKTFIFLMCTTVFSLSTVNMFSQEKILIDKDQLVTVKGVFKIIKKQTDFSFVYPISLFDNTPKIYLRKGEIKVSELVGKVLEDKNFSFEFTENNTIYIKSKSLVNTNVQKYQINGIVTDENGQPLPGANIIEKGTSNGAQTDFDGEFTLNIKDKTSVLVVSYLGFVTQEIPAGNNKKFNIVLLESTSKLDEIVIVGFAKQTKQTLVGAVTSVKGETLQRVGSVSTISEALQGAVPGLTAVNSGGRPGDDAAQIFIRGNSSWQGNGAPLTLVDGIEREINNLDPNEIETISVLKDASATAVYGVRGANGVILITTKRGKIGAPKFNVSSNFGLKQVTEKPDFVDAITAQRLHNEAATNDRNWNILIPESTINAWEQNRDQIGPYNQYFPEIDWFNELIGTGFEQTYNMNVSGGSPLVKYFVSLGHRNDGDVFQTKANENFDPAFKLKRYNWRSNFDFDITKSTKFSINFAGNYRTVSQPAFGQDNIFFNKLFSAPRNLYPIRYEDGFYGTDQDGLTNLIARTNEAGQTTFQYYQGLYDALLKQELDFITKGLSASATINYTSSSNYEKVIAVPNYGDGAASPDIEIIRYYRQYDYSNPITSSNGDVTYPLLSEFRYPTTDIQPGYISSGTPSLSGYGRRLNYKFQMDYKRTFGDHEVNSNTIFWRQEEKPRGGYAYKREEWIGRVNYYFKKRYLLEVNGSYSGSEKFARGKRFGFFPSIGAGWVVSEEPFIKKNTKNWLDFFKINYSYGVTGSDNGGDRFQYIQTYNINNRPYNIQNLFGYINVQENPSFFEEGALANTNSTWEESRIHNVSFKLEVLKGLSANLDLFKEDRSGILMNVRQPVFVGIDAEATGNIGVTKNHGYEFDIGWKSSLGDFSYNINFNTAFVENRTVFRNDPRLRPEYLKEAGKPIGWNARLIQTDLFRSLDDIYNATAPTLGGAVKGDLIPGDVAYADYNGDGAIDSNDQVVMDVQPGRPLRTYGLNLGANYKGFGMSALLYGVTDVGYVMPNLYTLSFTGDYYVQANSNAINRFTPETALTAQNPALHLGVGNAYNLNPSTLSYQDGAYLRLKNIEFNYKFDKGLVKKAGIKSLQLYANGNNLFTWSKLDSQIDPETPGANTYPVVKRYNLGLRITF
ncbi:SusC/RagA family TonB-linked outer membrane protein [Algibacter amylolyticus]|nr:TonB-dependent receptor [Algibacter amylolyticus]MBB5268763.1 TonB-linked SusC/RagA family outer membrane protein [Algibacter amylolyticus]